MKHIAIKKTSKDGHATILIENYLSEYGGELWRMCYRYNFTPDSPFHTAKDRLLHKPDNRQIRAFFSHFE